MDHAETTVAPNIGEEKIVLKSSNEPKEFPETESKSIPSPMEPKVLDTPARIKIIIPAGLYDLSW